MGSLVGHVVPGTAFGALAIWWTINFFLRYFETLFRRGPAVTPIRGRPVYSESGSNCPPWETLIRLVCVLAGMSGEYMTALDEQGNFVSIHNGQHMTMFGFFLFPVLFDLLYYYQVPGLPPDLDLASGALAFAVEGILFVWHLHGRNNIDIQVHTFLVYAIVLCSLSSVLETFYPHDLRPALLRSTFTLLQGTWFYHIGFILYPPNGWSTWKSDDHKEMMIVTMLFVWNLAAILLFQILVGFMSYCWIKRRMKLIGITRIDETHFKYNHLSQNDLTMNILNEDE